MTKVPLLAVRLNQIFNSCKGLKSPPPRSWIVMMGHSVAFDLPREGVLYERSGKVVSRNGRPGYPSIRAKDLSRDASPRRCEFKFPAILIAQFHEQILVHLRDTLMTLATSSRTVRQASQHREDAASDIEVLCHRVKEVFHVNPQGARCPRGHR